MRILHTVGGQLQYDFCHHASPTDAYARPLPTIPPTKFFVQEPQCSKDEEIVSYICEHKWVPIVFKKSKTDKISEALMSTLNTTLLF